MKWLRLARLLNGVAAGAQGAFGILAIAHPAALVGADQLERSTPLDFFTEMYGLRAVVLAAVIVAAMILAARVRVTGLVAVLGVAAVIQIGDVVIALINHTPGVGGAAAAAVVHLASIPIVVRARVAQRGPAGAQDSGA